MVVVLKPLAEATHEQHQSLHSLSRIAQVRHPVNQVSI